jgi:hypothetical protein
VILRVAIVIVGLLASRATAKDDWKPLCPPQTHYDIAQKILRTEGKLSLEVSYRPGVEGSCSFRILGPNRKVLTQGRDMAIEEPQYVDLDGDGTPELLVITDSGGSGGYTGFYVVTQHPAPRLAARFTGQCPIQVSDISHGDSKELITCDHDFEPEICNACNPFIWVHLRLEHGRLRDVSPEVVEAYDREITKARETISAADIATFRAAKTKDEVFANAGSPADTVMTIALNYLYSGRQPQALQTLREMWPTWDRRRVWKELLDAHREGALKGIAAR